MKAKAKLQAGWHTQRVAIAADRLLDVNAQLEATIVRARAADAAAWMVGQRKQESGGTAEAAGRVQTAVAQLAELSELAAAVQEEAVGMEAAAAGRVAAASDKLYVLVEEIDRLKALETPIGGGGEDVEVEWSG